MNRYLFVTDCQNDFADGAPGFPGAETPDEKLAAKVRPYGKSHILFTRDTHVDAACTDSCDRGLHGKVPDVLAGFQVNVMNR